ADRARGLPERVDAENPGGEHARKLRAQQAIRWNAPPAVQPQAIVQELRVRLQADVDEDSAELDLVHCAGLEVTRLHAGDLLVTEDLLDDGAVADADLRMVADPELIGRLRGERLSAV